MPSDRELFVARSVGWDGLETAHRVAGCPCDAFGDWSGGGRGGLVLLTTCYAMFVWIPGTLIIAAGFLYIVQNKYVLRNVLF